MKKSYFEIALIDINNIKMQFIKNKAKVINCTDAIYFYTIETIQKY